MSQEIGGVISAEFFFLFGSIVGWRILESKLFFSLAVVVVLLIIFTLYFFRDPGRSIPQEKDIVVSPADGRIVEIQESSTIPHQKNPIKKISIFLSLWDVHVNRVPVSGEVVYMDYRPGCFRPAFSHHASDRNEYNMIGIDGNLGRIYIRQIAGTIARRIVCRLRIGDRILRGERFGMIKFGSRVELYLPATVMLRVSEGDRVTGGESIIGVIHES